MIRTWRRCGMEFVNINPGVGRMNPEGVEPPRRAATCEVGSTMFAAEKAFCLLVRVFLCFQLWAELVGVLNLRP